VLKNFLYVVLKFTDCVQVSATVVKRELLCFVNPLTARHLRYGVSALNSRTEPN